MTDDYYNDLVEEYCLFEMQRYGTDSSIGKSYSRFLYQRPPRQPQLEMDGSYATIEDKVLAAENPPKGDNNAKYL